jgi:hypothetical protein
MIRSLHSTFILFCIVIFCCVSARAQYVGSCRIFPPNNWWNQDVSQFPVHPSSDIFVTKIDSYGIAKGHTYYEYLHPDFGSDTTWGIPYEVVGASTPFVHVTWTQYGDQSDTGWMPIPPDAHVEGGNPESNGGDRHVLVVDTSNHMLYECWQSHKDPNDNNWQNANGAIFDLSSNKLRPDGWTSGDAAGLPIFPGLVRYDEIQAGVINHAVRFTVYKTLRGWIIPARHEAGSTMDTGYPPMGLRMRLKKDFDISTYTGGPKVLLTALKKYGMILADNGSPWYISGATDARWDDNEWGQLKQVPGTAFEAVWTGPTKFTADNTIDSLPPTEAVLEQELTSSSFSQNFPNPFTSSTELSFSLDREASVTLAIYDMLGRNIASLANGSMSAGDHTIRFDAASLPAGSYIARLQVGGSAAYRMLQLVR